MISSRQLTLIIIIITSSLITHHHRPVQHHSREVGADFALYPQLHGTVYHPAFLSTVNQLYKSDYCPRVWLFPTGLRVVIPNKIYYNHRLFSPSPEITSGYSINQWL